MRMETMTTQLMEFFRSTCCHVTHQQQKANLAIYSIDSSLITCLTHLSHHHMGLQKLLTGLENRAVSYCVKSGVAGKRITPWET